MSNTLNGALLRSLRDLKPERKKGKKATAPDLSKKKGILGKVLLSRCVKNLWLKCLFYGESESERVYPLAEWVNYYGTECKESESERVLRRRMRHFLSILSFFSVVNKTLLFLLNPPFGSGA